jgi:hypothetical protein
VKVILGFLYAVLVITLAGCGGQSSGGPPPLKPPKLLVSDNQSGSVIVVDATTDVVIRTVVVASPGKMVSASGTTIIQSTLSNSIAVFDNASQTIRFVVPLPALPVDVALTPDGMTAWVAESNGTVQSVSTANGTVTRTVTEAGVQRLVVGPQGTTLLALNDSLTIFAPVIVPAGAFELGNSGLDHPTFAVFTSDDNNFFLLSCGKECGGTSANVTGVVLNVPGGPFISPPHPVSAVTMALLNGNSLFVAGAATTALNGGTLQAVSTSTLAPGAPVPIADGRHLNMALTSNGRLYAGSRGCTLGPVNGQNQRQGCLTIFDTISSLVTPVLLPASRPTGDVTGLAPVPGRNVIYVVQGGRLDLFDTTTNAVSTSATPPSVPGTAFDVVMLKP